MALISTSALERRKIRALFNTTENQVATRIAILKQWTIDSHLPLDYIDDWFLEIFLLRSKFDLNTTKKRIVKYFKYLPEYAAYYDRLENFQFTREAGIIVTSPRLTDAFNRVTVVRMLPQNVCGGIDWMRVLQVTMTIGMISFHLDYFAGLHFVLDFRGMELKHLRNFQPGMVFTFVRMVQRVAKIRIVGIELVYAPGVVAFLVPIVRMALSSKLFGRLTVHQNLESLQKNVPREFLPAEYGGYLDPAETMSVEWDQVVEKHRPLLDKIITMAAKLSHSKMKQGYDLEVEPSLRTLDID